MDNYADLDFFSTRDPAYYILESTKDLESVLESGNISSIFKRIKDILIGALKKVKEAFDKIIATIRKQSDQLNKKRIVEASAKFDRNGCTVKIYGAYHPADVSKSLDIVKSVVWDTYIDKELENAIRNNDFGKLNQISNRDFNLDLHNNFFSKGIDKEAMHPDRDTNIFGVKRKDIVLKGNVASFVDDSCKFNGKLNILVEARNKIEESLHSSIDGVDKIISKLNSLSSKINSEDEKTYKEQLVKLGGYIRIYLQNQLAISSYIIHDSAEMCNGVIKVVNSMLNHVDRIKKDSIIEIRASNYSESALAQSKIFENIKFLND